MCICSISYIRVIVDKSLSNDTNAVIIINTLVGFHRKKAISYIKHIDGNKSSSTNVKDT